MTRKQKNKALTFSVGAAGQGQRRTQEILSSHAQ